MGNRQKLPQIYAFSILLNDGAAYSVTMSAISAGYTCSIANPAGFVGSPGSVLNVDLTCSAKCGNLAIDTGETCDPPAVGCSATCQTEGVAPPGVLYATNFDTPDLEGWVTDSLWHLSTVRKTTGTHSVRYANPDLNNFDTGVANIGSVTSPTLTIGAGNRYLKFDYFLDGECHKLSVTRLPWAVAQLVKQRA